MKWSNSVLHAAVEYVRICFERPPYGPTPSEPYDQAIVKGVRRPTDIMQSHRSQWRYYDTEQPLYGQEMVHDILRPSRVMEVSLESRMEP